MKVKIPRNIRRIWIRETEAFGFSAVITEAGINYRTLKRAIETGECASYIYDVVNSAILRLKKKRLNKENKLKALTND